uniref:Uncharacterized protein n=1 Tax=Tenebrio molitor TaxID=7067 RepID=A0A8J6H3I2_TENMO|nr:hypothetical protein GEV33_015292 [Tenebrio molitor]
MTITTTFVTVLRRFEYLAEKLHTDRTDLRDFHEVSCARLKSCVVLRYVLDSVPLGTPIESEFPDLGSHGLFVAPPPPKKNLTSTKVFFFTVRIALGSLLFPALLFLALPNWTRARRGYARTLASPGANSDRNDSRTAELTPSGHRRTTPRGSGQIVPSEFRTFRNRASTLFASRVLSPATHAHPLLSSPFLDDTKRTQHNIHGRPIRPGILTLLTSRWCRKSVALPSTTLPSALDRHTHTSMARQRFLPSKKSSLFGGIRTH